MYASEYYIRQIATPDSQSPPIMDARNRIATQSDSLSEELIVKILGYCTPQTILRFASTCRKYFQLVESSSRLQLYIELSATGLEILGGLHDDDAVSSSALRELIHHRNSWLDLEFQLRAQAPSQELGTPPSLHDGILASAIAAPAPEEGRSMKIWNMCTSLLLMSPSSSTTARRVDFRVLFTDYCFDLVQELAVLIDMSSDLLRSGGYELPRIFLCSTSSGLPHPYALQPKLAPDFGLDERGSSRFRFCTANIVDNILLVKFTSLLPRFNPHTSEIWIWDWVSGIALGRIIRHKSYCQICFLDARNLLIFETTATEVTLALYAIALLPSHSHPSENASAGSPPMLSPTVVFQFPALHDSQKFFDGCCLLESGGARSCVLRTGSITLARRRVSTLALKLRLAEVDHCPCGSHGNGTMEFCIFISVSELLDIANHHTKLGITAIRWENWGGFSTRWFATDIPPVDIIDDLSAVHMPRISDSRYLVTAPLPQSGQEGSHPTQEGASSGDNEASGGSRESCFLSVLDFHTPTVNRFANRVTEAYCDLQQPATKSEDTVSEFALKEAGRVPEATLAEWLASDELSGQRKRVHVKTVGRDTPTIIKDGFAEPVVSRLPYRVVTRLSPVPGHKHWLMDGNYIIGSNSEDFGNRSIYTIGPVSESQEVSNVGHGGGTL